MARSPTKEIRKSASRPKKPCHLWLIFSPNRSALRGRYRRPPVRQRLPANDRVIGHELFGGVFSHGSGQERKTAHMCSAQHEQLVTGLRGSRSGGLRRFTPQG